MNKSTFTVILLLFLISQQSLATGQKLEGMDGLYHPMSDYIGQGKWLVVNVWSPSCSACVKELPAIRSFFQNNSDNIDVLGVTVDYPSFEYGKIDITRSFLDNHPLPYPIFLADHESASELIGNYLVAIPLITLFHPDGRAVARWPGPVNPDEILEYINRFDQHFVADPFAD